MNVREALDKTKVTSPQTEVEIVRGLSLRRTDGGIPVTRIHYTADPQRDPDINPEWKETERKTYSSQGAWDREQEIMDQAGGGELVFADTLITHWNKIVITDPSWQPNPQWRVEAGFDHGRASPTALLRCYVDYEGTLYFAGEYYQPGREIWGHCAELKKMADIRRVSACFADPSIFPLNAQANVPTKPNERAKSINEIYVENGMGLFSPFVGDHSDVSFAARLLAHWSNLEQRQPTVKIVCRNYADRPQNGLHNWDCPNLLWELMRTRRERLTAQQLLTRNISEAIVQKDDHARDACKYLLLSHPEPTTKSLQEKTAEAVKPMVEARDLTSASIRAKQFEERDDQPPLRMRRRR